MLIVNVIHGAVQLLGRALKKLPREEVFVCTKACLSSLLRVYAVPSSPDARLPALRSVILRR